MVNAIEFEQNTTALNIDVSYKVAVRNNPPWKSYVDVIKECVVNFSSNGVLISDLAQYVKVSLHADAKRSCGSVFLKEVAALKCSPQPGVVIVPMRVCIALIKANLSCPRIKVDSGLCLWITKGMVKSMTGHSRVQKTKRIETMMDDARKITESVKLSLTSVDVIKLLGLFDVRLVCWVLGIGNESPDKKAWGSAFAIGEACGLQNTLKNNML